MTGPQPIPRADLAPGLAVSRLGLGCAEIGNLHRAIDEVAARATLDAAAAAGMNFFDTAPGYGSGLSELRTGAFVRDHAAAAPILSTKVGRYLVAGANSGRREFFAAPLPFEGRFDYSYDGVMRSFDQSLLRLGVDKVDILFVHDLDTPNHGAELARHYRAMMDGGLRALAELRDGGAVRLIGVAVNEPAIGARMLAEAAFDVALLASRYTLLDQSALDDFLPVCAARGVRVVAGGVFNSGILATGARQGARYDYVAADAMISARVAALEAVCGRHGVALPAAAIQFVLAHPLVASVLVGTSRPERIAGYAAAFTEAVPAGFWTELRAAGLIDDRAPLPA